MSDGEGEIDLLEAMATARSFHRYRFDPIPEADLGRILWAGTRAPSGTNRQPFRFIVLRDDDGGREARALLGDGFRRGWGHKSGWRGGAERGRAEVDTSHPLDGGDAAVRRRLREDPGRGSACLERYREPHHGEGASIFPACQNILLAARCWATGRASRVGTTWSRASCAGYSRFPTRSSSL